MKLITVEIPANATYAWRLASWSPLLPAPSLAVGVMQIMEAKTREHASVISRYAIQELEYIGGRRFKVSKPLISKPEEPYYVFLSNAGSVQDECTCMGFQSQEHCKHVEGLRTLAERGIMTGLHPTFAKK
jgi:hypothetical protein